MTLAGTEALFVGPDRVALTLGGASVVIEDGEVTLNGKVNLGGKGGQPVARRHRVAQQVGAQDQLLALARKSPILTKVDVEGLPNAPRAELVIDREKAAALSVNFDDLNQLLTTYLGSSYVNDFPNRGKMQRVIVQAEDSQRLQASDILNYAVRNSVGAMVPMSSIAELKWTVGPTQIVGFNGYRSVRFTGEPAPGYTTGDAIAEMERLMTQLPKGFGYTWTGQSEQEKAAGKTAPLLLALEARGRTPAPLTAVVTTLVAAPVVTVPALVASALLGAVVAALVAAAVVTPTTAVLATLPGALAPVLGAVASHPLGAVAGGHVVAVAPAVLGPGGVGRGLAAVIGLLRALGHGLLLGSILLGSGPAGLLLRRHRSTLSLRGRWMGEHATQARATSEVECDRASS